MNKIAIKAAAVCLSLSMCSAAMLPAVSNVFETTNSTVVYAAESKVGQNLIKNSECDTTNKFGLYLAGGAAAKLSAKDGALDVSISSTTAYSSTTRSSHFTRTVFISSALISRVTLKDIQKL